VLILLPGETPGRVGDVLAIALQRLGTVAIKHGPVRDAATTLRVRLKTLELSF
jgi:phenylacetate-CoA ligase